MPSLASSPLLSSTQRHFPALTVLTDAGLVSFAFTAPLLRRLSAHPACLSSIMILVGIDVETTGLASYHRIVQIGAMVISMTTVSPCYSILRLTSILILPLVRCHN